MGVRQGSHSIKPCFVAKLNTEPEIGGAGSRPEENASSVSCLASAQAQEVGSDIRGKLCKPLAKTKKTKKHQDQEDQ